jgi:hypothetical protein
MIVDQSWQGDLLSFSRSGHVWIIASRSNDENVLNVKMADAGPTLQNRGVTTFQAPSSHAAIASIIGSIDEHHPGTASEGIGRWAVISVIGMRWDEKLRPFIQAQLPDVEWSLQPRGNAFDILRAIGDWGDACSSCHGTLIGSSGACGRGKLHGRSRRCQRIGC